MLCLGHKLCSGPRCQQVLTELTAGEVKARESLDQKGKGRFVEHLVRASDMAKFIRVRYSCFQF